MSFWNSRRVAVSGGSGFLSKEDVAEENATREAFALAYKAYYERRATMS